jgi:outer membrane protein assembly factor BamB
MKSIRILFVTLCALCPLWFPFASNAEIHRYLYCATPDGAQAEGKSGTGIVIFDIDDGHKFVKRIGIPDFKEGIRGFTGCTATKRLYFGTTNKRMGCFDIESGKVVWNRTYDRGCDRSCITADGKTIYAPTGWWHRGEDDGFLVIDPENGDPVRNIAVGPAAHNSIASLDGKFVYLGTTTKLTQFDAKSGKVLQSIEPVGESGVFPYTVKSDNSMAYVCLGQHVGVDVVDLKAGKPIHRLFAINPDALPRPVA